MPLPLAGILGGVLLTVALKILFALGIGFLTYTVALPSLSSFIQSYFTALPPEILQIVGILRIDMAMTMMLSALAASAAVKLIPTKRR